MSKSSTIGVLHCGEMGSAIGRELRESGYQVVTTNQGRSPATKQLANACGAEILPDITQVVRTSSVVLSLVPPSAALTLAQEVADSVPLPGSYFVDANSTSVSQIAEINRIFALSEVKVIDATIHGGAHKLKELGVLYLSGSDSESIEPMFSSFMRVRALGSSLGLATQMKLLLAGVSKCLNALFLEIGSVACRANMLPLFLEECLRFYPGTVEAVDRMLPTYPQHAARRVTELSHIEQLADEHGIDAKIVHAAAERITQMVAIDWSTKQGPHNLTTIIEQLLMSQMNINLRSKKCL